MNQREFRFARISFGDDLDYRFKMESRMGRVAWFMNEWRMEDEKKFNILAER